MITTHEKCFSAKKKNRKKNKAENSKQSLGVSKSLSLSLTLIIILVFRRISSQISKFSNSKKSELRKISLLSGNLTFSHQSKQKERKKVKNFKIQIYFATKARKCKNVKLKIILISDE